MTLLTDAQRRILYEGAQKAMGKQPADILMAGLPPQGWGDLATKADLRAEISGVRGDLDAGLAGVRGDLEAGLAGLRVEIAALRADLTDKIATHTWIHVLATLSAVVSVAVIPRVLS